MGYNKGEFFISGDSRRKRICALVFIIIILAVISIYSFVLHVKNNGEQVVKYDEESTLDYKVYLKENDFFADKFLGKDNLGAIERGNIADLLLVKGNPLANINLLSNNDLLIYLKKLII